MKDNAHINYIAKQFEIDGKNIYCEPFGHGHINDTYAVYYRHEFSRPCRYILQRINHHVFKYPDKVMENIENVTAHIRKKVADCNGDIEREAMTVVKTRTGENLFIDNSGEYWRAYTFVDNATCYQTAERPELFYEAARAFGKFQCQLADFSAHTLFESIPDFHNTAERFKTFLSAVEQDLCGRAGDVKTEIDFAIQRQQEASVLIDMLKDGLLPLRVTHNDTKLNNVLFDNLTDKGVCVIDLDTVMPGLSLYDFGDSIRFGASSAAEDEKNIDKVYMDIQLFELFTKGFLEEAKSLTAAEIECLPLSAKIMTFECGIRFLTDYLNGDTYFKTHYDGQNLDRCRTQFKLVYDMEQKMDEMNQIVQKHSR